MTSPSICQTHDTSIRHPMKMNSLYVCQPHDTSVHHTNIRSPSVCLSIQSSDHHTTTKTSPSLCQSCMPSVCHNVIPTSPSICQFQDSSVCKPTHDVIIPTVWPTNRSLPLWTLLAVLWQLCHVWITYGTVRSSTITMRKSSGG